MTEVTLRIDGRAVADPVRSVAVLQALGAHTRFEVRLQTLQNKGASAGGAARAAAGAARKSRSPAAAAARLKEAQSAVKSWVGKDFELTFTSEGGSATYQGAITRLVFGPDEIELGGRGYSYLMDVTRRTRSFVEKDVGEAIKAVLAEAARGAHRFVPAGGGVKFPFLTQFQETDFEFVARLASYGGYLLYDSGEGLAIQSKPGPGKPLRLGPDDLPDGPGSVAVEPVPVAAEAVACGYDPHRPVSARVENTTEAASRVGLLKLACASAVALFGAGRPLVHDENVSDAKQLHDVLKARSREAASGMVEYRATTGHPEVRAGAVVTLTGHPFADGPLLVAETAVEWSPGGYLCHFAAVPVAMAAGPGVPPARPMETLMTAAVTDARDPARLGRVKVRFPWGEAAQPWVRVLAGAAGRDHGSCWVPDVGDEVLIGFEHGDPSRPVVLGTLYHGDAKPPLTADEPPREVVLAKTKGGTEIRLIDSKDKEEVRVVMRDGRNELRLKLGKVPEVLVKTEGECKVTAKSVTVKATEVLRLEGKEVVVKATEGLNLEGKDVGVKAGGGLNLRADGDAVVRGRKVRLN